MRPIIKILVIDDDADDFLIIKDYINQIPDQQFVIDSCSIYKDSIKKICEEDYDICFVDYLLGAQTGLDLIEEVLMHNSEKQMIFLTGNGNRDIDIKAMQSGAVDYLVKNDLNPEKLERCIRYALERNNAMKLIRNSERKFRNIFERNKDTVFIANHSLFFTEVNNAAVELLGYGRNELFLKTLYEFIPNPEERKKIASQLEESGVITDKEIEIITKNGESKDCILTLAVETDENRNEYIQGIIHEITALKKVEMATLALEKLKMVNRFTRIMAHEVRNPLNNILLSVEELKTANKDEDCGCYIDIVERNGVRIENLITVLLNSSGPGEIKKEKKSLQSILDESIIAASDRINLKKTKVQCDYLGEAAWVMADHNQLKIAFLNIIINAIESMDDNVGFLHVSLKNGSSKGYEVCISDNGCGIKKENLKKLFEPYFTTKQNGLGLGLASTLNILQSHNAFVDVDSKISEGTRFKLFFSKA